MTRPIFKISFLYLNCSTRPFTDITFLVFYYNSSSKNYYLLVCIIPGTCFLFHSFRQPFLHDITITPETLSLSQSALVKSSSVEIDSLLYLVCVGHILVVTCNAGHSQRTERHTKTITKSNASPFQLRLNLMTTYQINLEQGSKLIKFPAPALSLISDIQGMPKSGHLPAKNICAFNPKAKEFPCQLRNPEDPDCALLRNGDPSPNKLNYIKAPFLNRA